MQVGKWSFCISFSLSLSSTLLLCERKRERDGGNDRLAIGKVKLSILCPSVSSIYKISFWTFFQFLVFVILIGKEEEEPLLVPQFGSSQERETLGISTPWVSSVLEAGNPNNFIQMSLLFLSSSSPLVPLQKDFFFHFCIPFWHMNWDFDFEAPFIHFKKKHFFCVFILFIWSVCFFFLNLFAPNYLFFFFSECLCTYLIIDPCWKYVCGICMLQFDDCFVCGSNMNLSREAAIGELMRRFRTENSNGNLNYV